MHLSSLFVVHSNGGPEDELQSKEYTKRSVDYRISMYVSFECSRNALLEGIAIVK